MPDEITTPAPAQAPLQAPAQASQVDPAAYDKLQRDYAASSNEARRLKQERDLYLSQVQNMNQPKQADPYDELQTWGVPTNALAEVVGREVEKRLAPIGRGLQARSQVLSQYPDYQKFEADVSNFVNADAARQQRYAAVFNADPEMAMDWAFLKYGEEQRRSQPAPTNNSGNKREQSDAQIPSGRSGESRNGGDAEGDAPQRLYKQWRETGSEKAKEAYMRARIGQAIRQQFYEDNR